MVEFIATKGFEILYVDCVALTYKEGGRATQGKSDRGESDRGEERSIERETGRAREGERE